MRATAVERPVKPDPMAPQRVRGRLFRKYVALFIAVVSIALAANGLLDIWFSYREQSVLLIATQREQARAAAARIGQFFQEIERQIGWMTQLPWSANTVEEWQFDATRLLRQVPAITEIAQLDPAGREQVRVSRVAVDAIGSQTDFSRDPIFVEAMANKRSHGPVYFRHESEPYMAMALAGARPEYGVVIAEVNLKFIWDVVSEIKVGKRGNAYVVDAGGRLIAHPDINLVLRNTDLSHLAQVQAARDAIPARPDEAQVADDIQGQRVLTAHAPVTPLGWFLFAELPVTEAYAPLYDSIQRSAIVIAAALILAILSGIFLARRMVIPIEALRDGAARIGSGELDRRITIDTDDELEALGHQFNSMAAQLQDSYATLERKVEERTQQLELANLAKSRFLAVASHDLRQPLHALGLFVAQLRSPMSPAEFSRIIDRVNASIAAMNELFNALLDISKLDAGVLTPNFTDIPIAEMLARVESTFAGPAREKNLSLRIVPSNACVRSDFILLEQILFNLVSNAVRYTARGGVVVGCRKRAGQLRIEVWDTGPGIAEDQRQNIFGEFYRLGDSVRDQRAGLGLGLAIVERLCRLLDQPIDLTSTVGKGSRFSVAAPIIPPRKIIADRPPSTQIVLDYSRDKLVIVIDDDPPAMEAMAGLLRSWGCCVITGHTGAAALNEVAEHDQPPDLIISDFRLSNGQTGIEAIERMRSEMGIPIPAFLISGDTHSELLQSARASGYHLLHKPVDPMTLRAMVNQMLKQKLHAGAA
ncbi:MAG TPA: ATP-binding protein [Steroidobacteraceae bacterium]|jgi:signal transduction histidine kinase